MSGQILLLNPRRKHKRRSNRRKHARRGRMPAGLARYWASRRGTNPRRHKRRSNRRRHARHSRASNPRVLRTGRHYRARSRRRHHSRRRRSNPRRFHIPSARGIVGQYVIPLALGSVGALGLNIGWNFVAPKLPASVQTGWVGVAAKSAFAIAAVMLLSRFVPRYRRQIQVGGLGAVIITAAPPVMNLISGSVPGLSGLSGYIDYQSYALPGAGRLSGYMSSVPRTLGSLEDLYSPAAVIQPPGTPVPQQFGGLRGYVAAQPHMSSGGGLMGLDWTNDGM